ncbi:MAG: hypothetical protein A3D10_06650 [Omnitrophica WOR_2 bacterium RIFCSPHIGHO2_02_FULL_48_11]|nr:MAG: hypothetical protein A3D10_06650 [Omnitrophica WOR_2 bacterium RIFCSPHIGHO2_02_FULL_48_11]
MLNQRVITRLFFAAVVFVGLSIPINRNIVSQYTAQSSKNRPPPKPVIQVLPRSEIIKNKLTVEDPLRYGVIVQKGDYGSWNDRQWEYYTSKTFSQSQALEHMEENNAFVLMKKTPEAFQKRWDSINQRIKIYEEKKHKNPSDMEAKQKLESLYHMRSTLSILKDKIITPAPMSSEKR